MGRLVRRRDGRGFEREILALTKLRTAIAVDTRIDTQDTREIYSHIDGLILKLRDLMVRGLNQEKESA